MKPPAPVTSMRVADFMCGAPSITVDWNYENRYFSARVWLIGRRFEIDSANGFQGLAVGMRWIGAVGKGSLLAELRSALQCGEVQLAAISCVGFLLVTRFVQT